MAIIQEKKLNKSLPATKPVKIPKTPELVVKSRFVRTPPDKIRLVGRSIIGKKIVAAQNILQFSSKAASKPLSLILKEATSRAKDLNLDHENLFIKTLAVDEGPKLKRRRIIHRGRATNILKRMSHITIVFSADVNPKPEARNSKKRKNRNDI